MVVILTPIVLMVVGIPGSWYILFDWKASSESICCKLWSFVHGSSDNFLVILNRIIQWMMNTSLFMMDLFQNISLKTIWLNLLWHSQLFLNFRIIDKYTPVNQHSWLQNGRFDLKMYFLLKMGIFQPAMLVYQRVLVMVGVGICI